MRHTSKRLANLLLVAALLISLFSMPNMVLTASASDATALGTNYYVDASNGNDNNDGTSESSAWRSITKVNSVTFQPGDQILFKAGCSWEGEILMPKGNGTANAPITISKYGEGTKPHFDATGKTLTVDLSQSVVINGEATDKWTLSATVCLQGQDYWIISDLDISNTAGEGQEARAIRQGIWVRGKLNSDGGITRGITIKGNTVHDVAGENRRSMPALHSMYSSAAIFVSHPGPSTENWKFDDLLIENNRIENTICGGLRIMDEEPEQKTQTYTNVVIRNNYISNVGSDGGVISHSINPLIEHNTVVNAGWNSDTHETQYIAGLWVTNCNGAIIQYNEVSGTRAFYGDGMAFDTDWGNSGYIIHQYNYTHDNEGGFFMNSTGDIGASGVATSILRYNISVNDGPIVETANGVKPEMDRPVELYNNVFYNDKHESIGLGNHHSLNYKNNVFYTSNGLREDHLSNFDANCYYTTSPAPASTFVPNDIHAVTANPCFSIPENGFAEKSKDYVGDCFKINEQSSLIDAGTTVWHEAGSILKDWFGEDVTDGTLDIGISEFKGEKSLRHNQTIQAEDSRVEKSDGLLIEPTAEGGKVVCNTNIGKYLKLSNVDFGSGAAFFEARVSGGYFGSNETYINLQRNVNGRMEIRLDSLDGSLIGILDVNGSDHYGPVDNWGATNGWNFYRTESCELNQAASGRHDVYLKWVSNGIEGHNNLCGFNLDYFRFASQNPAVGTYMVGQKAEAEYFTERSGNLTNEDCADTGKGIHVRGAKNGDWLKYADFDFGNGSTKFKARVFTGAAPVERNDNLVGGTLQIYLDQETTPIGTVTVSNTAGWQTVSCSLTQKIIGKHTVTLKWSGEDDKALFAINWFQFEKGLGMNEIIPAGEYADKAVDIEYAQLTWIGADRYAIINTNIGKWVSFKNIDLGDGAVQFDARVSAGHYNNPYNRNINGRIEIHLDSLDGPVVGTLDINGSAQYGPVGQWGTDAWSFFRTESCKLTEVAKNVHDVYLKWVSDGDAAHDDFCGASLEWIRFVSEDSAKVSFTVGAKAEAEHFTDRSPNLTNEDCTDEGAGLHVRGAKSGDWLKFEDFNFDAGSNAVEIRVLTGTPPIAGNAALSGGTLEFYLDEETTPIGTAVISDNAGWQTVSCNLNQMVSGNHTLVLRWNGTENMDLFDLNWIRFKTLAETGDIDAAAVDAKINAIGEVTLDKETMILEARATYNALGDAAKAKVTQLAILEQAEVKLAELKAAADADARAAVEAASVDAKIDAIGDVTLDKKRAIQEARAAYNALSAAAQSKVQKLHILEQAEAKIRELETAQDISYILPIIASIGSDNERDMPFDDISRRDSYYNAVCYLYKNNVMNGVSKTQFAPNATLTRAMVVTILYRVDGAYPVYDAEYFQDVPAGKWYTEAIAWAASNKIVQGIGNGKFNPNGEIAREQLAAILHRYAAFKGYDTTSATTLNADANISDWASNSVSWAVAWELLNGGKSVQATERANRSEVAIAIYTFIKRIIR